MPLPNTELLKNILKIGKKKCKYLSIKAFSQNYSFLKVKI